MKKIIVHILIVALPYLCVMLGWLLSFGAFDYQLTVTDENFYGVSIIYWVLIQWFVHAAYADAI